MSAEAFAATCCIRATILLSEQAPVKVALILATEIMRSADEMMTAALASLV